MLVALGAYPGAEEITDFVLFGDVIYYILILLLSK